jgi:predicted permease
MWAQLRERLLGLLRHRSVDRELDEELRFHVEQEIDANIARGLPPAEARRVALRDLGGVTQTRDTVRELRSTWTGPVWRDLTYAVRTLEARPGLSIIAVGTLALAIGANSAIFSVVHGILLKPLPYGEPDRLALVFREQNMTGAHRPIPAMFFDAADTDAWRHGMQTFASTALYANETSALRTDAGSDVIDSAVVSDSFFPMMRGALTAGRFLGPADDQSNGLVISDRLALRLYASAQAAVGQTLVLSTRPYTIIGVAARAFQFPRPTTDAWMTARPRCCSFNLIGRLRPGATIADASAEAGALVVSLRSSNPGPPASLRATVSLLQDHIVNPARPALLMLFAAAGLVLFVACANVAHLLLVAHAARRRERAIRSALGASRARLARQALIECLLLSAAGTGLGLLVAYALVAALVRTAGLGIPRLDAVHVDGQVLLFSIGLCVVTTIGTGLAPMLQTQNPADALKTGGTTTASRGMRHVYGALSVVQLAVSLVLIVGAILLGRSLVRLLHTDLGISTDHVVTASMNVSFGGRPTDAQTAVRFGRVVERIRALPGVRTVGLGTGLPPSNNRIRLTMRGRNGDQVEYQASAVAVTPGYFQALGVRLVQGRLFTDQDDLDHAPVMIMSVDTAKRLFGDDNPIGGTMTLPGTRDGKKTSDVMTLVGIVANVRYSGLESAPDDSVYRPFAQQTWVAPFLVARTATDPETIARTIRREIASVDRDIVVSDVKTMDTIMSDATASPRFRAVLLAGIAGLAVGIASIGLYGVIAQAVGQRTREIGVRMALGAHRSDILRLVLFQGTRLGVIGIACGLAGAFVLTQALTGLLYGVTRTDWVSYALASAAVLMLALVASYLPARRAAHVNPVVVLRAD